MKRTLTMMMLALFSTMLLAGSAWAADGECNQLYSNAFQAMKKDKACGQHATQWASSLAKQRAECRRHRDNLKRCNMAKRHQAKACRGQKRTCKTVCKDERKQCKDRCTRGKPTCIKACPKGKRGKNCRQTCRRCLKPCNQKRRKCKKVCRGVSNNCLRANRRAAHDCRSQARTISVFRTCQNARAMTRKAFGKVAGCAWKHFKGALECSAKDAIKFVTKNK